MTRQRDGIRVIGWWCVCLAPLVGENSRQRERLKALVSRLSDADLGRPLGESWTVSTALAHMAFWDRRALGMLERWERGEAPSPANPVGLNAALLPEWLALQRARP